MTLQQAVRFLMARGYTVVSPGEQAPKGEGRNRCDQCLRYRPCEVVQFTRWQRGELCLDCRLGNTKPSEMLQAAAPEFPIKRGRG